jgi:hypothetical protein
VPKQCGHSDGLDFSFAPEESTGAASSFSKRPVGDCLLLRFSERLMSFAGMNVEIITSGSHTNESRHGNVFCGIHRPIKSPANLAQKKTIRRIEVISDVL